MKNKIALNELPRSEYIPRDFTYDEVKKILRKEKLSFVAFKKWMDGQTAPLLPYWVGKEKKYQPGVYGWDLWSWINWQKGGKYPIWD